MTKEQVDEIRHAIVKGRPHLAKKLKSETPPVAVAAKGLSGASLLLGFDTKTCQGALLPAILLCAIQLHIKVLRRGSFPIEEVTTLSPLLFGGVAMYRPRLPPQYDATLMLMFAMGIGL